MPALRRNRGRILAVMLGALIGSLGAFFRVHGINTTDCLAFSAVFGCCLGAVWQQPGSGTLASLGTFGFCGYLIPHLAHLFH